MAEWTASRKCSQHAVQFRVASDECLLPNWLFHTSHTTACYRLSGLVKCKWPISILFKNQVFLLIVRIGLMWTGIAVGCNKDPTKGTEISIKKVCQVTNPSSSDQVSFLCFSMNFQINGVWGSSKSVTFSLAGKQILEKRKKKKFLSLMFYIAPGICSLSVKVHTLWKGRPSSKDIDFISSGKEYI